MDDVCKKFLNDVGIKFETFDELIDKIIERDILISELKYQEFKDRILELKKNYSSSSLTGLQNNADEKQKWPLLNIVRQLLNVYKMDMKPLRKSDGYTKNGVKKFRRFFIITKQLS